MSRSDSPADVMPSGSPIHEIHYVGHARIARKADADKHIVLFLVCLFCDTALQAGPDLVCFVHSLLDSMVDLLQLLCRSSNIKHILEQNVLNGFYPLRSNGLGNPEHTQESELIHSEAMQWNAANGIHQSVLLIFKGPSLSARLSVLLENVQKGLVFPRYVRSRDLVRDPTCEGIQFRYIHCLYLPVEHGLFALGGSVVRRGNGCRTDAPAIQSNALSVPVRQPRRRI